LPSIAGKPGNSCLHHQQRIPTDPSRTWRKDKRGLETVVNDSRTGMPPGMPEGAMCVQRFDDSLDSAIHTTYRISLRSSSMREPRDPLLKVFNISSFPFIQTDYVVKHGGYSSSTSAGRIWAHGGSNRTAYAGWVYTAHAAA
jgi:hypothetical protein